MFVAGSNIFPPVHCCGQVPFVGLTPPEHKHVCCPEGLACDVSGKGQAATQVFPLIIGVKSGHLHGGDPLGFEIYGAGQVVIFEHSAWVTLQVPSVHLIGVAGGHEEVQSAELTTHLPSGQL